MGALIEKLRNHWIVASFLLFGSLGSCLGYISSAGESLLRVFCVREEQIPIVVGYLRYAFVGVLISILLIYGLRCIIRFTSKLYRAYSLYSKYDKDLVPLLSKLLECGIVDFKTNFKTTGARITDYEDLRDRSTKTIFIMGIGMSEISQNKEYIQEQLSKGIQVRLLMINPDVITSDKEKNKGFYTTPNLFNKYFDRKGYSKDVRAAYGRLKDIKNELAANKEYSIEMRVYSGFYPINLTAIDVQEPNGELIIEFCCPNTTHRIRFRVRRDKSEEFFSICMRTINAIWNEATVV